MPKSLGNKRNKIGGYEEGEPDQIAEITRIYGDLQDGRTYNFTIEGKEKKLVVSKVFDNEDFGYHKITVERPLRINFRASEERIALLKNNRASSRLARATRRTRNNELRKSRRARSDNKKSETFSVRVATRSTKTEKHLSPI